MGAKLSCCCWIILAFGLIPVSSVAGETTNSILNGAFTLEQANRGASLYDRHCGRCHNDDMQGDGLLTPAIGRSAFGTRWSGRTLATVLRFISRIMPYDEAGKLDAQTYSDVLAYVLQFSGYPPGNNEIPTDATALGSMAVERLP